jgi:predicted NAD/FAD-binding protein
MTGRRIGIIGSGVAGLTAAWVLTRDAEVTLLEAEPRLGGHAHSHPVTGADGGDLWVDSGFLVHNRRTYPLLTALFTELGVSVQPSEMSMSVSCAGCGLAYAGQRGLGGLAAGLRRGGPRYALMLGEVLRFHRAARRLLATPAGPDGQAAEPTLGEFLAAGGYSRYFVTHFAMPFVAAVWSCPPQTALDYPARYLFTFLNQHGLLSVTGSPPWLTVSGGSRSYVDLVAKQLAVVRTGARVSRVARIGAAGAGNSAGVSVSYSDGGGDQGGGDQPGRSATGRISTEHFDAVVIATHPDQALSLLAEPTPAERAVLGAFRYSRNDTVLHTDDRVLPPGRRVRASWNYALTSCDPLGPVQVSYDLNRLHRLPPAPPYVVTLNPAPGAIEAGRVVARMGYEHPVYDPAAVAAQRRLPGLNDGLLAYAGAYHGWGFHEDGCRAGVAAARSLGGRW